MARKKKEVKEKVVEVVYIDSKIPNLIPGDIASIKVTEILNRVIDEVNKTIKG